MVDFSDHVATLFLPVYVFFKCYYEEILNSAHLFSACLCVCCPTGRANSRCDHCFLLQSHLLCQLRAGLLRDQTGGDTQTWALWKVEGKKSLRSTSASLCVILEQTGKREWL